MPEPIPTITVLGIPIAQLTCNQALALLAEKLESTSPTLVAYANAHSLNVAYRVPKYRRVLSERAVVLNDGSGLAIAAKLQGKHFPANLNGTDFTPKILRLAAQHNLPVFLLGGAAGIAERAAEKLRSTIPGLQIAGFHHGYFSVSEESEVLRKIRASTAQVLLVAMGNPQQELWLDQHLASLGIRLGVAVGAFLDFTAGKVSRAPLWMRNLGAEWLYRLWKEPRRLFSRYIVGNPLFLARVVCERIRIRLHKGSAS